MLCGEVEIASNVYIDPTLFLMQKSENLRKPPRLSISKYRFTMTPLYQRFVYTLLLALVIMAVSGMPTQQMPTTPATTLLDTFCSPQGPNVCGAARKCIDFLFSRGDSLCEVSGQGIQVMCEADNGQIKGYSTTGRNEAVFCRNVASAVQSLIAKCPSNCEGKICARPQS